MSHESHCRRRRRHLNSPRSPPLLPKDGWVTSTLAQSPCPVFCQEQEGSLGFENVLVFFAWSGCEESYQIILQFGNKFSTAGKSLSQRICLPSIGQSVGNVSGSSQISRFFPALPAEYGKSLDQDTIHFTGFLFSD